MAKETKTNVHYPGREILLADGQIKVMVFPVGVRHIDAVMELTDEIASAVQTALASKSMKDTARAAVAKTRGVAVDTLPDSNDWIVQGIKSVAPVLLRRGKSIIKDCVTGIDIDELPHWELPAIIDAWIEESFGDEKKTKPWIELVTMRMGKISGAVEGLSANLDQK